MNNHISLPVMVERLEENRMPYGVLPLQDGMKILVTQRGGRIFGPFLDDESGGLLWANNAWAQKEPFGSFLESGHWNLGGDRMWIAPELQYSVTDRKDFFGSFRLQKQMDPGVYTLERTKENEWRLAMEIAMEAEVLAKGTKELSIERRIRPIDDPLRALGNYAELIEGVRYAGYEQIISMREKKTDDILTEVWSLLQINPGGELLIPAAGCVEQNDYYQPIDDTLETRYEHHISLKITGNRTYKLGFKAAHVFGRIGYFNDLTDGQAYVLIRNFFNNPSSVYAEELDYKPGCHGHSIHVYNDNGELGGFGELECNGQTFGGNTGRSGAVEQLLLWFYVGEHEKIKRITYNLLGVRL